GLAERVDAAHAPRQRRRRQIGRAVDRRRHRLVTHQRCRERALVVDLDLVRGRGGHVRPVERHRLRRRVAVAGREQRRRRGHGRRRGGGRRGPGGGGGGGEGGAPQRQ